MYNVANKLVVPIVTMLSIRFLYQHISSDTALLTTIASTGLMFKHAPVVHHHSPHSEEHRAKLKLRSRIAAMYAVVAILVLRVIAVELMAIAAMTYGCAACSTWLAAKMDTQAIRQ